MACSCGKNKKTGAAATHTVVLPGGKQKVYSSVIAAKAEVARVSGAYLKTD